MMRPQSIQMRVSLLLLVFGLALLALNAWDKVQWMRERQMRFLRDEAEAQGALIAGMMQHCFRNNLRRAGELQMSYASTVPGLADGAVVDEGDVIRFATRLDWIGMRLGDSPLRGLDTVARKVRDTMTGSVAGGASAAEVIAGHPIFTRYDSTARGVVLLRFDGAALLHHARLEAMRKSASQACILLALCAVAWVVLDILVTERVRRVLAQAREWGEGGLGLAALTGDDEMARISQEFARSVTRVRETEARLLEASEAERRRIGRDIHDDVCQRIAAAQLKSGVLSSKLASEASAHAALAEEVGQDLREAAQVTRVFARGLSPVWVGKEGLAAALQELTEQLARLFGIQCELECDLGEKQPAVWVQTHVFRIVQELAANAAKHALPTRINTRVRVADGWLRVEVENDGLTFEPGAETEGGLGMQFLQQRVRVLGGRLAFLPRRDGPGTLALCEARLTGIHFTDIKNEPS